MYMYMFAASFNAFAIKYGIYIQHLEVLHFDQLFLLAVSNLSSYSVSESVLHFSLLGLNRILYQKVRYHSLFRVYHPVHLGLI